MLSLTWLFFQQMDCLGYTKHVHLGRQPFQICQAFLKRIPVLTKIIGKLPGSRAFVKERWFRGRFASPNHSAYRSALARALQCPQGVANLRFAAEQQMQLGLVGPKK